MEPRSHLRHFWQIRFRLIPCIRSLTIRSLGSLDGSQDGQILATIRDEVGGAEITLPLNITELPASSMALTQDRLLICASNQVAVLTLDEATLVRYNAC